MSENQTEETPVKLTGRQKGEKEVLRRWGKPGDETGTGETLTARERGELEARKRFG